MDVFALRQHLSELALGGIRAFDRLGSTNDEAMAWAQEGAPDMALVIVDEQTSGRGRGENRWISRRGTGLTFSVVLKSPEEMSIPMTLYSGLGALAVCDALEALGLKPAIKWPNDVLLHDRKVCGILVETAWSGNEISSLVLGIGVNITAQALHPEDALAFAATSVETELGKPVEGWDLLKGILRALLSRRQRMTGEDFVRAWEQRLAFRDRKVIIQPGASSSQTGRIDGLEADGSLRLILEDGDTIRVHAGEVQLRLLL